MLDALLVICFVYGIRYLMLFNRPMEKLDAGDIAFINKQRKRKQKLLTIEEVKASLKGRGIAMLVTAGVLVFLYAILMIAVMSGALV